MAEVVSGWRRLHEEHAIVLDAATGEIRMANPFSAVPTAFRVSAAGRWWHANCAWDAFGICAALGTDGRIETFCPDCDETLTIEVRAEKPDHDSLLFHALVPARDWWGVGADNSMLLGLSTTCLTPRSSRSDSR